MSNNSEALEGRRWAQRLLRKPLDPPPEEIRENEIPAERKAEIRAEVEAEMRQYYAERQARQEREGGQRMAENALRHRRAVERPRDPLPSHPVGSHRNSPDGTVWKRVS